MKSIISFLLLLSLPGYSQLNFSDSAVRQRVFRDVHVLASDSFAGRRSGTPGSLKASEYIAVAFRAAGLTPAGDSGTFFQNFTHREKIRMGWSRFNIFGNDLYERKEFSPVAISADGRFTGIITKYHDSTSYYKGNGVLFDLAKDNLTADTIPGTERIREISADLINKGAGIVVLWDSKGRLYPQLFDFNRQDTVTGLVTFVNKFIGKDINDAKRPPDVIIRLMRDRYRDLNCRNVAGFIDNGAPYTIIIGGHYDHMGLSKKNQIRYGADDNASGTATVMELARYLKVSGSKKNNYMFIAFDAEELGLLGSTYFSAHPLTDLSRVNYMFNFDMVGRLGCEGNKVYAVATSTSPDWPELYKTPDHPFRISFVKGAAAYSDHAPFYNKGIPVAYLTTGLHYDYHTPTDTPDRINYDGMVSILKYLRDFIEKSEDHPRISYNKVSGWNQFRTEMYYIGEVLEYLLVVGSEGTE